MPASRSAVLDEADRTGIWIGAAAEASLWARDPWATVALRFGVEQRYLRGHFRVPLNLRIWDFAPVQAAAADGSTGEGAAGVCRWFRCRDWQRRPNEAGISRLLPGGLLGVEPLRILRLIEHLEIGSKNGPFSILLAPARLTLGDGQLVRGVLSSPFASRTTPAARATLSLFDDVISGDLLLADLSAPQELAAARLSGRPLALIDSGPAWARRLLHGFEIGAEAAIDFVAPTSAGALDGEGDVVDWQQTRPVAAAGITASWNLASAGGLMAMRPFAGLSAAYGLAWPGSAQPGSAQPGFGAGSEAGLAFTLRAPYVGVALEVAAGLDSPGFRTGLFSTLYLLERRRSLSPAASGGTALELPATGGPHARLALELAIAEHLRGGFRLQAGSSPGTDVAEVFLEAISFGGHASVRVLKRLPMRPSSTRLRETPNLTLAHSLEPWRKNARWDTSLWAVGEIAIPIWGPLSFFARWLHAPRFLPRGQPSAGKSTLLLRSDDDVTIGIAGDLALDSPWLNPF